MSRTFVDLQRPSARPQRRWPLCCVALALMAAGSLDAAPDPDIFDGRIEQSTSPAASESSSGPGEKTEPASPSGGSQQGPSRDFSEVGEIGGQGFAAPGGSKSAADGSGSTANASSDPAAGSSGSEAPLGGGGSSGTAGANGAGGSGQSGEPAAGGARDFSSIGGVGTVSSDQVVEVNTSKAEAGAPATGAASTKAGGSAAAGTGPQSPQRGSGTGGSGSQPFGSGSGDIGETLPSGL